MNALSMLCCIQGEGPFNAASPGVPTISKDISLCDILLIISDLLNVLLKDTLQNLCALLSRIITTKHLLVIKKLFPHPWMTSFQSHGLVRV